jgi:dipeptidyl aminopeptidase/acylaminoacyl peptidase
MNAQSPARHAELVKAPILLMHSDKDVTVPIEQSRLEADALKRANKDVQFVTMEGDDHQLSYAQTRIRMLMETEKFLAAHIGK